MKHKEYDMQVSCVEWFRLQYPRHLIYHIPNGERRDAITGARLKRGGVVAGVPDLCIPYPCGKYTHLYVELKNGTKGRLSPNQKAVIDELRMASACVEVAHSFEEFVGIVRTYFSLDAQKI